MLILLFGSLVWSIGSLYSRQARNSPSPFLSSAQTMLCGGALMMLALACYLIAAVFYLTNFYAPFRLAEQLGLWAATAGVFFNLASWLVRWVAAYDRELEIFTDQGRTAADMPWAFRYVPFANLYI